MTAGEQGFLLLTSHLGDPARPVLTVAQFRELAQCVRASCAERQDRELTQQDLMEIGYGRSLAQRIVHLLAEQERLAWYLQTGAAADCIPIARVNGVYPVSLRKRLGLDSPGCLWCKGDISLLDTPKIALVGSRELNNENLRFARELGKQAALQGITLISGNARGADAAAQKACLSWGGNVISVLPDALKNHPLQERVLYLAEDGFDLPFSTARALSRNRVIHALGSMTFVAQCQLETGGTWDGTWKNLRYGWSPVLCFDDGSAGAQALTQLGAEPVSIDALADIVRLQPDKTIFDQ